MIEFRLAVDDVANGRQVDAILIEKESQWILIEDVFRFLRERIEKSERILEKNRDYQ